MPPTEKLPPDIPAALLESPTPRNQMALCVGYRREKYESPAQSSKTQHFLILRTAHSRVHSRNRMDKYLHIFLADFPRIARNHRAAAKTILCVFLRTDDLVNTGMLNRERSRFPALAPSFAIPSIPQVCQAPDELPCAHPLRRRSPTDFQHRQPMAAESCSFLCGARGQSGESAENKARRIPFQKRIQASECNHEKCRACSALPRTNGETSRTRCCNAPFHDPP